MTSPTTEGLMELKPCAHCGEPGEMDARQGYLNFTTGKLGTAVAIYCTGCGIQISHCREDMPDCTTEDLIFIVAQSWNSRAPDLETSQRLSALEGENEALRGELEEALDGWEDCAAYKGDFLREKHGDIERLSAIRSALTPPPRIGVETAPETSHG